MKTLKFKKISFQAFTLVEVIIALAVFSLCILSIMGLLTEGLSTDQISFSQNVATNISGAISADLHSMTSTRASSRFYLSSNVANQPIFWFDNQGNPLGNAAIQPPGAFFRANVYLSASNAGTGPYSSAISKFYTAQILLTWPASYVPVWPPTATNPLSPSSSYLVVTYLQLQ